MNVGIGTFHVSIGLQDEATESALVDRCRKKDLEAFGKLVDVYQNRVHGFIKRMTMNPSDAADLTQEVFIRAYQNIERFDGRSSVRTWLFRIAYNICVDRSRKLARSPKSSSLSAFDEADEDIQLPDSRWQPEQMVLDAEMKQILEQGIEKMSEKLRAVLLLHDREDISYEEIAKMLSIPVGTVKSRLFLARSHLQNVMNEYLHGEALS